MKKSKNILLKAMININQIIEGFIAIICVGMLIWMIEYRDVPILDAIFSWYFPMAIIAIILVILNSVIIKKNYKYLLSTSIVEVGFACIYVVSSVSAIERIEQIIAMTIISLPSFLKLWICFDLQKLDIKKNGISKRQSY